MVFKSTKTYGHDIGLSCTFRQWRATHSHCSKLHGYALSVHLEFAANELDHLNWVVDFGNLKTIKQILVDLFDHKLVIAEDDPERGALEQLGKFGLADVVVIPHVGCERFAQHVAGIVQTWLRTFGYSPRVWLSKVEVREHGANSGIWELDGITSKQAVDQLNRLFSDHLKTTKRHRG